ncbi:MAG: radical SAM protein [Patescibacteria group bacterium]|nr:radical SAM protein [Patescibacteria group bacterium]MCL5261861.1 radical SAM protein [Patescibacteria group bacterium]
MKISEEKKGDEGSMVSINLGAFCNQNCVFCLAADGKEAYPRLNAKEAREIINGYLDQGGKFLLLTGGESTIHPDFVEIIGKTLEDPRVSSLNIMTNGVRLGDKDFFDAVIAVDPKKKISFSFSLHGPNAELAESITRGQKGDFEKTCAAMKYAIQSDRNVDVAIIIIEQNYRYLPEYAKFIIHEFPGIDGVSFGYPLLFGNAEINKDSIYVKFSDIAPYLQEALKILLAAGIRAVTAAGAPVPLCVLSGIEDVSVRPLIEWQRRYIGTATSGRLNTLKDEDEIIPKVKPEQCAGCALNDACVGVLKCYADIFGSDGVVPVTVDNFRGPIVKGSTLSECLPKLDQAKLNLIVLSGDDAVPGLYAFPEGKIGVVVREGGEPGKSSVKSQPKADETPKSKTTKERKTSAKRTRKS